MDCKREVAIFQCVECGKKFRSYKQAVSAQDSGCPCCGGIDIDVIV